MILGLTGSIGMGKSTTAQMFRDRGIAVWDADAVVHALYAPGGAAIAPVAARFPGVRKGDTIDRAALRAAINAQPDTALDDLNTIVHPLVAADRARWMRNRADTLVVWDVPLLFETGTADACDRIAVVTVDADTQRARILERGTMTPSEVDLILSRQMPDADKRARADYIIETTDMETARAAVDRIVEELT
ncbi:dephospho-CoA kinase [Jannaschia donghaensis]|uniref:Dephospho-CoA kinase n=1 Tax=Jannaschia donghaensis TaxID=420998 RepID=A0A0M6YI25_9RHOB|nr:dephospho-CoA kinase [Jannaschia donghaensis]CTQ49173.1 Dephospho-CoA kinase [Jannaschia donghaensis]